MNQHVPDWNMEENPNFKFPFPSTNSKKPSSPNNDLVELLWQNGHVVMNSQGSRKIPTFSNEYKQAQKARPWQNCEQALGDNSSELIQDDASASWLLDETMDRDFCSEFFLEMTGIDAFGMDKLSRDGVSGQARYARFGQTNDRNVENSMPAKAPQVFGTSQTASRAEGSDLMNFPDLSRPGTRDVVASSSSGQFVEKGPLRRSDKGGQESSVLTVGSSVCGSNQIVQLIDRSSNEIVAPVGRLQNDRVSLPSRNNAYEVTVTSSSGGSGCSTEAAENGDASDQNRKRKAVALEESGSQSEDLEYEWNEGKKQAHQSKSARRSRAAEVHNLAERRRRDRINEKMKALQDLIPHCNKTDKASMLDEAIEYLKSLQLQVQMMWMGSGMVPPMMFTGVQQYMPSMGIGFGHTSLPSIHNAVQLPRAPFLNQPVVTASTMNRSFLGPPTTFNAVNFPNQMSNLHIPDSYGRLFSVHQMQPQSQIMQQNQLTNAPNSSVLRNVGGAPCPSLSNSKSGE